MLLRKLMLLLVLAAVSLVPAGCWDNVDINELAFITGIAIDLDEKDRYKLTVEGLNPTELVSEKAAGFASSITYTLDGDSISEISQKMNMGLTRQLNFSHMRVIVISEKLARKGDLEFLDFLERFRESRDDFYILVANGTSAKEVLSVTYPVQRVSSLKLFRQLDSVEQVYMGEGRSTLRRFIEALTSPGRQPLAVAVTVKGNPDKGKGVENIQKIAPDAIVTLTGTAAFKGQRLVGFLNMEQSRNARWIQGRIDQTSLAVACSKDKTMDIRVYHSASDIRSSLSNGKPRFQILIEVESRLNSMQCVEDLNEPETYRRLEKLIADRLTADLYEVIEKAQTELKADIFGLGEIFARQHYKAFKDMKKNWDEHFAEADIDLQVSVKIRRTGNRVRRFQEQ